MNKLKPNPFSSLKKAVLKSDVDKKGQLWKPKEIIVHAKVRKDFYTEDFLAQCPGVPVQYVTGDTPREIIAASQLLREADGPVLSKIVNEKQVVYIAPAENNVHYICGPPMEGAVCPHFENLKLSFNGCCYTSTWYNLDLTYRNAFHYISICLQYEKIKEQIVWRLYKAQEPVIFDIGELRDSLSTDRLTGAHWVFIPFFGESENGYLYVPTRSDNLDHILNLPHNHHVIVAWSVNSEMALQQFEPGYPSLEERLMAAKKVQDAGYRVRVKLNPILPIKNWQKIYGNTIKRIFDIVSPEAITINTLSFKDVSCSVGDRYLDSSDLAKCLGIPTSMFEPMPVRGGKRRKSGQYTRSQKQRMEIFLFAINEIRKHSDCPITLGEISDNLWNTVDLKISKCKRACQLDPMNMVTRLA